MRRRVLLTLGLAAWFGAAANAQDEPDLSFLEYLGTWQEDDEEWLAVEDWEPPADAASDETEPGPDARPAPDRQVEDEDE